MLVYKWGCQGKLEVTHTAQIDICADKEDRFQEIDVALITEK